MDIRPHMLGFYGLSLLLDVKVYMPNFRFAVKWSQRIHAHFLTAQVGCHEVRPGRMDNAGGDVLLVNTADRRLRNGEVFAFRTEDGPRLKRLNKQMDGRIRVISDNPDKTRYPDEYLTPGMEAEIIGHVVHRSGGV